MNDSLDSIYCRYTKSEARFAGKMQSRQGVLQEWLILHITVD